MISAVSNSARWYSNLFTFRLTTT